MRQPAFIKQLSTAHAHLRSAARYLAVPPPSTLPNAGVPLDQVESLLTEEGLLNYMEQMALCGARELPQGGFWRDLERAAETLGREGRSNEFRERFVATLSPRA